MRAIILAAGKGERLQSVEPNVPKPMVRIADTPVLEFTVEHLNDCGIHGIIVTTGHLSEQIIDYFEGQWGLTMQYTVEKEPLGTAGGFKEAMRLFGWNGPVLVWNGDNFSTCDPRRMLEYHKAHGGDATMAICWRKNASQSSVIEWSWDNRITYFREKAERKLDYGWVNAGIYILNESVMDYIPDVGDFGYDVFPSMIRDRDMFAYGFSQDEWLYWYDTPADLAELRKRFP
jgi:mannose-1-phosphate guanylyltransferase/phosphomannomutase